MRVFSVNCRERDKYCIVLAMLSYRCPLTAAVGLVVLSACLSAQTAGNGGTPPPRLIPDTNWRLSPLFDGRDAFTTLAIPLDGQEGSTYFVNRSWAELNHDLTYGSRYASWAYDTRGTTTLNVKDGSVLSSGRIVFSLLYPGPYVPPNFRSFWTISASGAASTSMTGTASAASSPSTATSQGYGVANSSGSRLVEVTGDTANLEISFGGQANQPKEYSGDPLAQLSGSLRAHNHPSFTLSGSEPGNESRSGPNARDGRQDGTLDIAAVWSTPHPYLNGSWLGLAPYVWNQDLYASPGFLLSGAHDEQWGEANSGRGRLIAGGLGADTTSSRLGQVSDISSKLKDRVDSANPTIEIKTKIRWHKPVENPIKVDTAYLVYQGIEPSYKQTLPAGVNTPLVVKYTNPGAFAEISSEVVAAIGVAGAITGAFNPAIGAAISAGGILLGEWGPKDEQMGGFMAVYDSRWRNFQGHPRMGIGIVETGKPEDHKLEDVMTVYLEYTAQKWDVETYLVTGYGGQGLVTTHRLNPLVQAQGRFKYYDPTGGTPPGGGGGTPGDGTGL